MTLTTREAVESLCYLAADFSGEKFDPNNRRDMAVKTLCEYYGFKLSQFFDCDSVERPATTDTIKRY